MVSRARMPEILDPPFPPAPPGTAVSRRGRLRLLFSLIVVSPAGRERMDVEQPYSTGRRVTAWSLVVLQLALLAGLVLVPGRRIWPVPGWLAVVAVVMIVAAGAFGVAAAMRLGAGLTPSPLPPQTTRLQTTGVYACVRHPIYTALLLGGAGVILLGGRLTRVWVWLGLLALLLLKTRLEEAMLIARFPGYADYAATTPRLMPNPAHCLSRRPGRGGQ